MTVGEQVLVVGVLLAGGVVASLLAGRLRVPSLLLFLAIGILTARTSPAGSRSGTTPWRRAWA